MVLTHRTIHYQLVNNDKRFCWHLAEISPPHESLMRSAAEVPPLRSQADALRLCPTLMSRGMLPLLTVVFYDSGQIFAGQILDYILEFPQVFFSVKTQNVRKSFSGDLPSTYSMPRIPRVKHVDHFSVCRHTFQKTLAHQTRDGNSHRCSWLLELGQGHRILLRY